MQLSIVDAPHSYNIGSVNHYLWYFNILQRKLLNELGPEWYNIAEKHYIKGLEKIA